MMDLKALKYFVATVEEGRISAAAERLFIAQPSVSLAIAKLEGMLACQLLIRSKTGVVPTQAGQSLYQQAKALLNHAQAVRNHFIVPANTASLTISIASSIAFSYLGQCVSLLRKEMPGAKFRVCRDADDADLRIIPALKAQPEEMFIPLWQEIYQLILPLDHPLAYQQELKLQDLHGQAFIERSHCERNQEFKAFLGQFNVSIDAVAVVDNEEWALMLVENGVGMAVLPLPEQMKSEGRFICRSIDAQLGGEQLTRQIGIALDYQKFSDARFQTIVDTLKLQV